MGFPHCLPCQADACLIGGQPNMYMQNFRCHVTGSTSTKKVAAAKPPVYCADDQSKCQAGAKQMIAWNRKCYFGIMNEGKYDLTSV